MTTFTALRPRTLVLGTLVRYQRFRNLYKIRSVCFQSQQLLFRHRPSETFHLNLNTSILGPVSQITDRNQRANFTTSYHKLTYDNTPRYTYIQHIQICYPPHIFSLTLFGFSFFPPTLTSDINIYHITLHDHYFTRFHIPYNTHTQHIPYFRRSPLRYFLLGSTRDLYILHLGQKFIYPYP